MVITMHADEIEGLKKYVSVVRDFTILDAVIKHGTTIGAALELGLDPSSVRRTIRTLKARRDSKGITLDSGREIKPPDDQFIKGTSGLYNAQTGEQKLVWVKTDTDAQRRFEAMRDACMSAFESYKGKSDKHVAPKKTAKNLLTVIPFGDPHIGMYSWAKETGEDFDCDIAQSLMFGAVDRLCDSAPDTDTCIILSVGDTFHADTSDNRSLNSGHSFDVDSRWARVLEIGISTMMRCIDRALQKHKKVIFKAMPGNHDKHTSMMLGTCLSLFYANNKRVVVDTSPAYFWYHRFGNVLIGSTHGDTCKPEALTAIMADDAAEDWGATKHRYWYTGHIHNQQVKEFRGVVWESFRTLAPRDAWHATKGYGAGRDLYAIVHDFECGEIERHRCDVRRLMR